MGTNALQAHRALESFSQREPGRVLALAALYPNLLHLVTLDGTGVESLADLAGRRVSVGAPGSGTEVGARMLLEGNGISYDEFEPQRLNFNETANALRDGSIDAGFLSVSPPTSAIMDLATARPVAFGPVQRRRGRQDSDAGSHGPSRLLCCRDLSRPGRSGDDAQHREPCRGLRRHARRARLLALPRRSSRDRES